MIDGIVNFFSSIGEDKIITKDDVIGLINRGRDNIQNNVLPALDVVYHGLSHKTNKGILDNVVELGRQIKLTGGYEGVTKGLIKHYRDSLKFLDEAEKIVNKSFPDSISSSSATGQAASIVKAVSDITDSSTYVLDLVYKSLNGSISKAYDKGIESGRKIFISVFTNYNGKFDTIAKDIEKASREQFKVDATNKGFLDTMFSNSGNKVSLPSVGFINNPFYHIGMWWADRKYNEYVGMKEKREALELKIMALNLDASTGGDAIKINKQLEYYEDKLDKINYKIQRYENS